jgi:hypothetical protein
MYRRRRYGRGALDSIGRALGTANRFLRSTRIISRAGNALGSVGVPYASQVGAFAGSLGYGRQRGGQVQHPPGGPPIDIPIAVDVPVTVPQYRRPKMDLPTRAKAFVKRHKLVSRGLRAVGARSLADKVSRLGYGKRKRRKRGGCRCRK